MVRTQLAAHLGTLGLLAFSKTLFRVISMIPTLCTHPECSKEAKRRCADCFSPYCSRRCQMEDWQTHQDNCWTRKTGLPPQPSRRASQSILIQFMVKLRALALVPLHPAGPRDPSVVWRLEFILRGIRLVRNFIGADRARMARLVGWHLPHDPLYLQALVCLARSGAQVLEVGAGLGFLAAVARALGVEWTASDAMNGWGSTEDSDHWISDLRHEKAVEAVRRWLPQQKQETSSPLVLAAAWFPPDVDCVDDLKTASVVWLQRFPCQGVLLMIGDPTPRKERYKACVQSLLPELRGSENLNQLMELGKDTTADPAMFLFFEERKMTSTFTLQGPYPLFGMNTFGQDQRWALELTGGLVGDQYTFVHSAKYAAALFSAPLLSHSAQCKPSSTFTNKFIVPIVAKALTRLPMDLCSIIIHYAFIVIRQ